MLSPVLCVLYLFLHLILTTVHEVRILLSLQMSEICYFQLPKYMLNVCICMYIFIYTYIKVSGEGSQRIHMHVYANICSPVDENIYICICV